MDGSDYNVCNHLVAMSRESRWNGCCASIIQRFNRLKVYTEMCFFINFCCEEMWINIFRSVRERTLKLSDCQTLRWNQWRNSTAELEDLMRTQSLT